MNLSDLLRDADPLLGDAGRLDESRDRIRRAVVAGVSFDPPASRGHKPLRRVAVSAVVAMAAFSIAGLFFGSGDLGLVNAAVRFEVRLAETAPAPGLIVARVADSGRVIYLHPEMIVTNDDIAQSAVVRDGDRFSVSVELLDSGAQRMRQATASHLGRPVAILIDGDVVTAPVVRSAITNSAVISGGYTRTAAERIANGISMR